MRSQYQTKHANPETDILCGSFEVTAAPGVNKLFGNGWRVSYLGVGSYRVTLTPGYIAGLVVASLGSSGPLPAGISTQEVFTLTPNLDIAVTVGGVPTDVLGVRVNFIAHVQRVDLPRKTNE